MRGAVRPATRGARTLVACVAGGVQLAAGRALTRGRRELAARARAPHPAQRRRRAGDARAAARRRAAACARGVVGP
eukprot:4295907-Prymnesium_polylepis.1